MSSAGAARAGTGRLRLRNREDFYGTASPIRNEERVLMTFRSLTLLDSINEDYRG